MWFSIVRLTHSTSACFVDWVQQFPHLFGCLDVAALFEFSTLARTNICSGTLPLQHTRACSCFNLEWIGECPLSDVVLTFWAPKAQASSLSAGEGGW
jgi:hypothetical protein